MHRFIASGFGVGIIPSKLWGSDNGAGTFGAALAAGVALLWWERPWWWHIAVFAVFLVLSLWSAAPFADHHADPGWIVIDEMAGTFVAVIGLAGWPWLIAVLVARLADIFKVLPGHRLNGCQDLLESRWMTWLQACTGWPPDGSQPSCSSRDPPDRSPGPPRPQGGRAS